MKALEKSDVYTLGNILFYLLTMEWLCMDYSTHHAVARIGAGNPCPMPEHILTSTDKHVMLLKRIVEWVWILDPNQRPHAWEVRDLLEKTLQAELGVSGRKLTADDVRVHVEPLPKGYTLSLIHI